MKEGDQAGWSRTNLEERTHWRFCSRCTLKEQLAIVAWQSSNCKRIFSRFLFNSFSANRLNSKVVSDFSKSWTRNTGEMQQSNKTDAQRNTFYDNAWDCVHWAAPCITNTFFDLTHISHFFYLTHISHFFLSHPHFPFWSHPHFPWPRQEKRERKINEPMHISDIEREKCQSWESNVKNCVIFDKCSKLQQNFFSTLFIPCSLHFLAKSSEFSLLIFLPSVCLLLQCLEWNGWTWVRPANGRKTQRFVWQDTTLLLCICICICLTRHNPSALYLSDNHAVWQFCFSEV